MSNHARKTLADADGFDFADERAMAGMVGRLSAALGEPLADSDFATARTMAAAIGRLREALRMALAQ
jgi:hypothetical protein